VAAWGECVDAGVCAAPSGAGGYAATWDTPGFEQHPVNYVDHGMAKAYCEWRGRRLCTEAEWEKAARGTDERLYPWGDVTPDCTLAVIRSPGGLRGCDLDLTWPVGSMPAGASPYGALDMAGNVGEWVADWFSSTYYSDPSATSNPTGPATGGQRVNRGGTFEVNGGLLRCSARGYATPAGGYSAVGFRCAATP
jgi:formylglycine-generating enzyme required for sulfatase activity